MSEETLPRGWVLCSIADIGKIVSGGTPSTANPDFWGDDVRWISPSDLTGYKSKFIARGTKSLSELGLENCSAKLMPAGSVHFSSRAPIGYVVISSESLCTNQGFKSLVPAKDVFNEYVYFYFKSIKALANSLATGTTFKELSGSAFAKLPIPLPPLNEQKRIVAKIEELFSELEAGEESLRKARRQLGVYRQSLLKQAFEGKLTQEWRVQQPEAEPASNFLKRILEQRKKQWSGAGKYKDPVDAATERSGEIPNNWLWTATDSVCSQITDGEHIQPRYKDEGLPMLTAKHVRDGYVVFDDAGLISPEDFETCLKRCAPTKDDVLIVSVGATTGRTGIVGDQPLFALVRSVLLLRPLSISPQYLLRWNQSPWCMKWKTQASGATAQPHLYIRDTRRMPIPLCALPEQQEIVRLLDEQFEVIERNEREIDAALKRSEALRQAILKKAFTGHLVPQDPADEPTAVLLARLREPRRVFAPEDYFAQLIPALLRVHKGSESLERLNAAVALLFQPKLLTPLAESAGTESAAHFKRFRQPLKEAAFASMLRLLVQNRVVDCEPVRNGVRLRLIESETPPIDPIVFEDARHLGVILPAGPVAEPGVMSRKLCPPSLPQELLTMA